MNTLNVVVPEQIELVQNPEEPHVGTEEEGAGEEYFQAFKKEITEIDDVANIVLKGHLLIEAAIDRIIRQIFFHPEYVLNNRHNFERKVQLARAMSLNAHSHPSWDAILAINSLRNEIAHKHPGEDRKKKADLVRKICLASLKPESRERYKNDPDSEVIVVACAMCHVFLTFIEEHSQDLREEINGMLAKHHAEKVVS